VPIAIGRSPDSLVAVPCAQGRLAGQSFHPART
jgi:hypothetical protein